MVFIKYLLNDGYIIHLIPFGINKLKDDENDNVINWDIKKRFFTDDRVIKV